VSLVVLDTDVASNILRGRVSPQLQGALAGHTWFKSFVTLGEPTKWTIVRSGGPRKLADLAEWRRNIVVLPGAEQTATTWGELQARAQLRGRPRPIDDTWIAATCIAEGIPLATFNTKDYEDFAQPDGLTLFDVS
jgi:toxin FitB